MDCVLSCISTLHAFYCIDYRRSNDNTLGLPYSFDFNLKNRQRYNLYDTFTLILRDLNKADSLLSDDNDVTYDNTFQRDYHKGRVILFNKYAVKATKARVYYAWENTPKRHRMHVKSSMQHRTSS